MKKKEKPLTYMDTHAGSGGYQLTSALAQKTGEYINGVKKIFPHLSGYPALELYKQTVEAFNQDDSLGYYPGSPMIARHFLRKGDQAILCELHPREYLALKEGLKRDKRFHIHQRDGLAALVALTPPTIKRGLVIVDPSYEVKNEYAQVAKTIISAQRRWPGATYMIWYPMLPEERHNSLIDDLAKSDISSILRSELIGPKATRGMFGTGLLTINPPYGFETYFDAAGKQMASKLFDKNSGRHEQTWLSPE